MKTKIEVPPDCESCNGETEWYQPNFAYQCHFCGHIGKVKTKNQTRRKNQMKPNIQQVIDNLKERGKNDEYIVLYLKQMIEGIQKLSPKVVDDYIEINLFNQNTFRSILK